MFGMFFLFIIQLLRKGKLKKLENIKNLKELKPYVLLLNIQRKRLSQSLGTAFNQSKYIYYSVLNLNLLLISFRWVYKSRFFISFLL